MYSIWFVRCYNQSLSVVTAKYPFIDYCPMRTSACVAQVSPEIQMHHDQTAGKSLSGTEAAMLENKYEKKF